MAVDPQAQQLLDQIASLDSPPLEDLSVDQARQFLSAFSSMGGPGPDVERVQDLSVPGPDGEIPVRTYIPEGATGTLVWFHGGGFTLGSLEDADPVCRQLAVGSNVAVMSVDYRLAPEHPHPAGPDDCYAATRWAAEHAAELGRREPADRGLAVGGDSAGGTLAAVVALRARARGGPPLAFQLLVYPMTDATMSHPSIKENGEGYMLTAESMRWFMGHYVRPGTDLRDADVSPLFAEDLSGLPPALVVTAEFDPLRDEGEAYAAALERAKVPVTLRSYAGMIHGFFSSGAIFDAGKKAVDEASRALDAALGART